MVAYLVYAIRWVWRAAGNLRRRLRRPPEYVVFLLEGRYPDLPPPRAPYWRRWLSGGGPPPSLFELGQRFRTVAADGRVKGVVLHLRPLALSLAQLQWLHEMVAGLRAAGKRVVAWATTYDTAAYYVACAADEVLLQPGGTVAPLGLRWRFVFLAETLESAGIKADVVRISPYKTGFDRFAHREMSDEAREMARWLIESDYDEFLAAIAHGRHRDETAARQLVDGSPYSDLEAVAAGAVDGLLHEEELPHHLAPATTPAAAPAPTATPAGTPASAPTGARTRPVRMVPWEAARGRLLRPPLSRPGRHVALVRIEGVIVDGWSGRPPFGPAIPFLYEPHTGDLSVTQQARRVLADRRAAALLLYVNSGGGSAAASEAIAAALARVAARKPVVVWMSGVAASGGYYVATPARWIVAQPGTVTGSIGVLAGKFVASGLLEKLRIHQEVLARGEHAGLYDPDHPFSPAQRQKVFEQIRRTYDLFVERVALARRTTPAAVDRAGGGRVWTGRQALQHGLVDELGSFEVALRKTRELAGLDPRARLVDVPMPARYGSAPAGGAAGAAGGWPAAQALEYATWWARALRPLQPLCLCPIRPLPPS